MADKNISRVTINGNPLMDIHNDSVTPETLMEGETAHDRSGTPIVGTGQGGGGDTSDCYKTTDSASTDLADSDYIPFNDVSDSEEPKKKVLFSTIIDKLKSTFLPREQVASDVDASKADNDVSVVENISTTEVLDKDDRVIAEEKVVVNPDGNIGVRNHVKNYDTNGDLVGDKGIDYDMNKLGELTYLVSDPKSFSAAIGNGVGQCTTAEGTNAKTATLDRYVLAENGFVCIKFTNAVPANSTLNVNGKGAKPIFFKGVAIGANIIRAGDTVLFSYDGTNYNIISSDNSSVQVQPYVIGTTLYFPPDYDAHVEGTTLVLGGGQGDIYAPKDKAYLTDDTTDTTIADGDYLPFNDVSDNSVPKKKITLSNLINKFKDTFATITQLNGKQDTLTFDNLPTLNSNNPVKSGGVYNYSIPQYGTLIPDDSDLNTYTTPGIYNIPYNSTAATISNIPIQIAGKLIVMNIAGNSYRIQQFIPYNSNLGLIYQRSWNNESSANIWHDWYKLTSNKDIENYVIWDEMEVYGSKNLLPNLLYNGTYAGITFTKNSDGSVTCNGTATATQWYGIYDNQSGNIRGKIFPYTGTFILSGCPSGNSNLRLSVEVRNDDDTETLASYHDDGYGVTFSLSSVSVIRVFIRISNGAVLSNVKFYPMIRLATVKDSTYVPHALPNKDLTDMIHNKTYIGTCSSAAGERIKVATVDDDFSLKKGVRIGIKFSNTNTFSSSTNNPITLNVNGTGAKNIWYGATHSGAGNTGTNSKCYGYANRYNYYVFDGSYWVWDGCTIDDNTTYSLIDATQIQQGTDTSSRVVRADYLKSGIRRIMGMLDGIQVEKPDNSGYPCYLLFKDVTTWYNSTTTGQATYLFEGLVISERHGGNMINQLAEIGMGVSYQKVTYANETNLCLKTTHDYYQPQIISDGSKYYLALRVTSSGRPLSLIGRWANIDPINVGTWVNCTDASGTMPSGWSISISGGSNRYANTSIQHFDTRAMGFGLGTCSTAAATTAKVAALDQYTLKAGGYVTIKFDYDVPASATLDINSRGSHAIYYRGSAITAGIIKAGDRATFVYNGTQYDLVANDRWGKLSGCWVYSSINQNVQVNCDGTKTNATLLAELYTTLKNRWLALGSGEVLEIIGMYSPNCGEITPNRFGFYLGRNAGDVTIIFSGDYNPGNSYIVTGSIILRSSDCKIYFANKSSSTDNFVDNSTTVWGTGNTFVVRYNVLRQI